jgi:hypothetical protein
MAARDSQRHKLLSPTGQLSGDLLHHQRHQLRQQLRDITGNKGQQLYEEVQVEGSGAGTILPPLRAR